mmetsp:Transcript_22795/g.44804  ORF Transcript_22795/g.44804 Transcript_22795/m.44804 type:complete len:233 (-) Transcript_22795:300-998(-)|eukprot:CAMPEP_0171500354 /NCGR_PEP_ID=MMETSP0958-20121227/8942_1 /TAXON_ID=87120 /ORGANISM="Aurantiochytrium limacinum, Strain ATCCMYA-1381" /LENGTH=232 /DNA_ID=CAMNT_0012035021 /DNA_START=291 /DNA_END=989 /DNA_ORIENTATION=+
MADELIALFGKITTNDHDQLVDQFSKILQVDRHVASFFLEASQWNVETAVSNYLASMHQNQRGNGGMNIHPLASPPQAVFVGDLAPWQSRPFQPGTLLPIRLRFQNTGPTAWPPETRLTFVDGDQMNGTPEIPINAGPGEIVETVLVLEAPRTEGTGMGSWRLACIHGYFGDPIYLIASSHPCAAPVTFPASEFQQQGMTLRQQSLPLIDQLVGDFNSKLASNQEQSNGMDL